MVIDIVTVTKLCVRIEEIGAVGREQTKTAGRGRGRYANAIDAAGRGRLCVRKTSWRRCAAQSAVVFSGR